MKSRNSASLSKTTCESLNAAVDIVLHPSFFSVDKGGEVVLDQCKLDANPDGHNQWEVLYDK